VNGNESPEGIAADFGEVYGQSGNASCMKDLKDYLASLPKVQKK